MSTAETNAAKRWVREQISKPDVADDDQQDLMRMAVAELQSQYGWDERTAASVMLTVTTAVGLAPKSSK